MATDATDRRRTGQSGKSIEESVGYAISHRTRVHLLIILSEGTYCASELAEIIGVPLNSVSNHLKELAGAGSIEIAETKKRRNFFQHYYRAVENPAQTREDLLAMHPFQRQVIAGLHAQSLLAEVMAALDAKKISTDPDHMFLWNRLYLDEQGREEIGREQKRHWERLQEIGEESTSRSDEGERTVPYIVSVLGFERGREAPATS